MLTVVLKDGLTKAQEWILTAVQQLDNVLLDKKLLVGMTDDCGFKLWTTHRPKPTILSVSRDASSWRFILSISFYVFVIQIIQRFYWNYVYRPRAGPPRRREVRASSNVTWIDLKVLDILILRWPRSHFIVFSTFDWSRFKWWTLGRVPQSRCTIGCWRCWRSYIYMRN